MSKNKDNENIKIIIGHYDGINGKDSIPIKDIEPTTYEIEQIILHHMGLIKDIEIGFAYGQSGSWEIRQLPYSLSRIEYLKKFITEERFNELGERVFKNIDKIKEEIQKELEYQEKKYNEEKKFQEQP